jgi:hypothetical protein
LFELTVKVKDADSTYKKDFCLHGLVTVDQDDPQIKECIDEVLKEFGRPTDKIEVKIHLEVV